MASQSSPSPWLDRPIFTDLAKVLKLENLLILLILVIAIVSRFAILGERVMSHDEVNHVVPSYDLFQGKIYRHDPVTHGPFQFHVVALSYFLFGDNDFTSRIPAAIFSVAAVLFVLIGFRRYLGRAGALVAGFLFLISPFMLFYGRYTRNEGFIELLGVLQLYAMLRYLDKGDRLSMFLMTITLALHFTVKETAFIYTAQGMIFLFFMFLLEVRRIEHNAPKRYNRFMLLMLSAMVLVFVALALGVWKADATTNGTVTATVPVPEVAPAINMEVLRLFGEGIALAGAVACAVIALLMLVADIGWGQIRRLRSFSLLLLTGTLILPMLSPFPVSLIGWNPLDYNTTAGLIRIGAFIFLFFAVAVAIGWWWNAKLWLQNALIFYAIFTVLYTTFFTNGAGFFTGMVGSLGYWLSQQSVERGSQPLYYYALVQVPIYEFLALLGSLLAVYFGIRYNRFSTFPGYSPAHSPREDDERVIENAFVQSLSEPEHREDLGIKEIADDEAEEVVFSQQARAEDAELHDLYDCPRPLPVLALLLFWAATSLVAYSIAGEKMPWLTVHIALPMLLAAGWGLGYLIDTFDWKRLTTSNGLLAVLLIPVLIAASAGVLSGLMGSNLPFQGNTLEQLQATSRFIISLIATLMSAVGILYLLRDWRPALILQLATAAFFTLLTVLTARAAYRASYINYDQATEYLVYAHAARGPKDALDQIEEISRRVSGGKDIMVAYSNDGLYPYWWYLRDYPNHRWFQDNVTRDLRDYPIIIAGEDVFSKIDSLVAESYIRYDYMRLWWPNQDYMNLTWERIWGAIRDPNMRAAIFDIWLNRDYTEYARLTSKQKEFDLETWSPGAQMRLYIRKDIIAQIWNYGASPAVPSAEEIDPYEQNMVELETRMVIGSTGSSLGQLQAPRGIKVAPDGSIYVADSKNHRIQQFSPNGDALRAWGSFADQASGDAPGGTFNEPWDVAVGPDGSVYVSDTWNHRVQKFTGSGEFISMWGYFGQGEAPEAFWGPRGLGVDADGRVYVMDTGNDRVVVFDAEGNFISQFGTEGFDRGQLDEPVGIAIDQQDGKVFISDTWNQRIQVFVSSANAQIFTPVLSWDVKAWLGESLENKPFLALSPVNDHLFIVDPEASRVLEFTQEGDFVRGWGDYSDGADGFGLASGVAVTQDGQVWVSDGANNRLLLFEPPLE